MIHVVHLVNFKNVHGYSSQRRFCSALPTPQRNSSLASYFASKIVAFKNPLPLGISGDLPWGGDGFFWNYTLLKDLQKRASQNFVRAVQN